MAATLLQKVWDAHTVRILPTGQTQLFVGLHLIHEVTTPQAFDELRQRGWKVRFPSRTFGTVDHIIPTREIARPFKDDMAEAMMSALERNCRDYGIPLWDLSHGNQGIVHVIGPELGLTQPGMTIACGDSHTSTHGAFGAVAFGIGTSQVRDVLASQCLAMEPLQVRRIDVTGQLAPGVYAKDVILEIIRQLGREGRRRLRLRVRRRGRRSHVDGRAHDDVQHVHRRRRARRLRQPRRDDRGLSSKGRPFAPQGEAFGRAKAWWTSMASDADAQLRRSRHDRRQRARADRDVGRQPGAVDRRQRPDAVAGRRRAGRASGASSTRSTSWASPPARRSRRRRSTSPSSARAPTRGCRICARRRRSSRATRSRRASARLVVPGSQGVAKAAVAEGLDQIFREAGFEWRGAGCSMCLGMNPDKLQGAEMCASSSNRNFKGRQGSPTGRTLLMSPAMVAAAAIAGEVVDVRKVLAPALTAR